MKTRVKRLRYGLVVKTLCCEDSSLKRLRYITAPDLLSAIPVGCKPECIEKDSASAEAFVEDATAYF